MSIYDQKELKNMQTDLSASVSDFLQHFHDRDSRIVCFDSDEELCIVGTWVIGEWEFGLIEKKDIGEDVDSFHVAAITAAIIEAPMEEPQVNHDHEHIPAGIEYQIQCTAAGIASEHIADIVRTLDDHRTKQNLKDNVNEHLSEVFEGFDPIK